MNASKAFPLPDGRKRQARELTRWMPGNEKPAHEGLYLREFDEGIATSEFNGGEWLRDGFFPSDIQCARWRGLKTPNAKSEPTARLLAEVGSNAELGLGGPERK